MTKWRLGLLLPRWRGCRRINFLARDCCLRAHPGFFRQSANGQDFPSARHAPTANLKNWARESRRLRQGPWGELLQRSLLVQTSARARCDSGY